jgi:ribosomal-protein-alanine N-acetyltransferase
MRRAAQPEMGAGPSLSRFAFETQAHVLLTERLMLRPPRRADFHAWARLRTLSRDFLRDHEPGWRDEDLTRRAFEARLRQTREKMARGEGWSFLLFSRETGALMGGILLYDVRRAEHMCCTAGAWMGAPFAHRGHMTEAMRALAPYAFDVLGLTRMEADSDIANEPAIRTLEAAGFRREGVARAMRWRDGEWRDHVRLARVSPQRSGG